MTEILIKMFIKDYENTNDKKVRITYGNFASVVGIICNVFLCIIKMIIGLIFNSVAIIADSINNLTDIANSVISLIGFVISGKPADKDHPYGHARYEYLACLLVSFVVLMLGLTLLKTSFLKILHPESITANYLTTGILIIAILIKLWMSLFYKKVGKIINSNVLNANSVDSLNDVISTAVVLLTTIIAMLTDYNLDGIAGCLVSMLIIYSGLMILRDTIDELIGTTPEPELINNIISRLKSYDDVMGIHDLVVHSYGPANYFATVHVEVPSDADIGVSHDMIDNIERDFQDEMGINLVIHLDPIVTDDNETNEVKITVLEIIRSIDENLSIHDFRMVKGDTHTNLIFDILLPAGYDKGEKELIDIVDTEIKKHNPKYNLVIRIDKNFV